MLISGIVMGFDGFNCPFKWPKFQVTLYVQYLLQVGQMDVFLTAGWLLGSQKFRRLQHQVAISRNVPSPECLVKPKHMFGGENAGVDT